MYLDNGMRVCLYSQPNSDLITLLLIIQVGSSVENERQYGMAHFMEHILFRTDINCDEPSLPEMVEQLGGEIEGHTYWDYTLFKITITPRYIDLILEKLAEVFNGFRVKKNSLENEKEVIIQELNSKNSDLRWRIRSEIYKTIWPRHPYGRPILGSIDQIRNYSCDQVQEFFHQWYTADNLTLLIIGDISQNQVSQLVHTHFKKLETKVFKPQIIWPVKGYYGGYYELFFKNTDLIEIAIPITGIKDRYFEGIKILGHVFHNRVKKEFPGYTCNLEIISGLQAGLIVLSFPAVNLTAGKVDIYKAINKIIGSEINDDEVELAQCQYNNEINKQLNSTEGVWHLILERLFKDTIIDEISSLKAEKLLGAEIKKSLDCIYRDNTYIFNITNKTNDNAKIEFSLSNFYRISDSKIDDNSSNKREKTVPEKFMINHTPVIFKPDNYNDKVAIVALIDGGRRCENQITSGLGAFLTKLWTKGTTRRSVSEYIRELNSINSTINCSLGMDDISLYSLFPKECWKKGIELFFEVLYSPLLPENQLPLIVNNIKEEQGKRQRIPIEIMTDIVRQHIFPNYPYSYSFQLGSALSNINIENVYKHYNTVINNDLVLVIVGDINKEELTELLAKELRSLPKTRGLKDDNYGYPRSLEFPRSYSKVVEGKQGQVCIAFKGVALTSPLLFPVHVGWAILEGVGGRLFSEIRRKRSLAYQLTVYSNEFLRGGFVISYAECAPEQIDDVKKIIVEEFFKVSVGEISPQELQRAKDRLLYRHKKNYQYGLAIAKAMAKHELLNKGYQRFELYPELIAKIEHSELVNGVKDIFNTKNMLTIDLFPSK